MSAPGAGKRIVYRVEHQHVTDERGNHPGPYTGVNVNGMGWAHTDDEHPTPHRDGYGSKYLNSWTGDHYCAFRSEADLAEWFDGWVDKLTKRGHVMRSYEVDAEDVLDRPGARQILVRLTGYTPATTSAVPSLSAVTA